MSSAQGLSKQMPNERVNEDIVWQALSQVLAFEALFGGSTMSQGQVLCFLLSQVLE